MISLYIRSNFAWHPFLHSATRELRSLPPYQIGQLSAGMPQCSWLDPLIFLILIDDLRLQLPAHKYVDDTTITEIVTKQEASQLQRQQ